MNCCIQRSAKRNFRKWVLQNWLTIFSTIVGLSSLGAITLNEYHFGGLVLPSHEYTWETDGDLRSNLPFTKRFSNFVKMWRMLYIMYHDIFPRHQKLAESFLGPIPPLQDIMTNTSLLFVDQSDVLTAARPKLANMVTFTSSHIVQNPDPLPKVRFDILIYYF